MTPVEKRIGQRNWLFDVVKGFFIGSGFIVPGVSGGAISAIFGVYEPLIGWLANIREDFKNQVRYFFPMGVGGLLGLVFFSFLVSWALGAYQTIMLWAFVGTIAGMVPSLWREAGREGRSKGDLGLAAVAFVLALGLLLFGDRIIQGQVQPSFLAWLVCGFLISLGILVPGLSPSNFILYMGLYEQMARAFSRLDVTVMVPIALGGGATIFLLAKGIERLFKAHYAAFNHVIFGVVLASTLMIVPRDYSSIEGVGYLYCLIAFVAGGGLGAWMAKLEDKYK